MPKLKPGRLAKEAKVLAIFDHLNLQLSTFKRPFDQLPFPGTFSKPFASH
jgi:hypothetical protein